ncbi:MAG: ATP-grasp domain-containing protein [Myxococcota bacterium]
MLVTGARAPVALDWLRRLKAGGHAVWLADSVWWCGTAGSRHHQGYLRVPPARQAPRAFLDALAQACVTHAIDWILPTCEEVFWVAQGADDLPARVFVDRIEGLENLHHKGRFAELTHALGHAIQAPPTQEVGSRQEAEGLGNPQDWVFKPAYSRFASRTQVGPEASVLRTIDWGSESWVAQRRIRGVEHSTFGLAHEGRLVAHGCYRSVYRVGTGSGVLFRNVTEAQPLIREFVERLVAHGRFTGQIGFDFLTDASGTYVIECNPRATSGLHLFAPGQLMEPLFDPQGPLVLASGEDRSLGFAMPMVAEAARPWLWRRWWRDWSATRDVVWDAHDVGPFVRTPLSVVEFVWRGLRTGRSPTGASTFDIEWDGTRIINVDG